MLTVSFVCLTNFLSFTFYFVLFFILKVKQGRSEVLYEIAYIRKTCARKLLKTVKELRHKLMYFPFTPLVDRHLNNEKYETGKPNSQMEKSTYDKSIQATYNQRKMSTLLRLSASGRSHPTRKPLIFKAHSRVCIAYPTSDVDFQFIHGLLCGDIARTRLIPDMKNFQLQKRNCLRRPK